MLRAQDDYVVRLFSIERVRSPEGELCPAIVMELYSSDLIRVIPPDGLPEPTFRRYLGQICRGLQFVHSKRIIMRDLKPQNVLMDASRDRCVLTDFGIAKFSRREQQDREEHIRLSTSANLDGPPRRSSAYFIDMAHDGCDGDDWDMTPIYGCVPDARSGEFSSKSDLYCLAQTAYHMWTGKAPSNNPASLPKDIPAVDMLQKCLMKDPAARPTATEVLQALEQ